MGGHWSWVRVPDQGSEKVALADMAATTDCTLYRKSRAGQRERWELGSAGDGQRGDIEIARPPIERFSPAGIGNRFSSFGSGSLSPAARSSRPLSPPRPSPQIAPSSLASASFAPPLSPSVTAPRSRPVSCPHHDKRVPGASSQPQPRRASVPLAYRKLSSQSTSQPALKQAL